MRRELKTLSTKKNEKVAKYSSRFMGGKSNEHVDRYYVAYKLTTFSYILSMFIEMKFIDCHYCVILAIKSMNICND